MTLAAVQTGHSVIFDRLPVHIMAGPPRARYPLHRYYSDAELDLGGVHVKDVLLDVSQKLRAQSVFDDYRALHKSLAAGLPIAHGQRHWDLDKYKIMPMHGDAYRAVPQAKWQVAIDADSFLFTENLLRYLASKDAGQHHYLGQSDSFTWGDRSRKWAHGGAGYAVSKRLLDDMLARDPWRFNYLIDDIVTEERGGDVILGTLIAKDTNGTIDGPNGGEKLFNRNQVRSLAFNENEWYLPVLSLHHLSNAEVYGLRTFEADMLNLLAKKLGPRGDYIRRCDIASESSTVPLPRGQRERETRLLTPPRHTFQST